MTEEMNMARNGNGSPKLARPALDAHVTYAAPWRERMPDGSLSAPYGPPSPAAQATRAAKHRDWTWRPSGPLSAFSKESRVEAERMVAWLDAHEAELPDRERQVATLVYRGSHAIRWIARQIGVSRDSARSYLQRVRDKAGL